MINASVAIIYNDKREVLLLKKEGHWQLPGGKQDQDESPYQTLCREVLEEANLTVLSADHNYRIDTVEYKGDTHEVKTFLVTAWEGEVKISKEHTDLMWIRPIDALNLGNLMGKLTRPILQEQVSKFDVV